MTSLPDAERDACDVVEALASVVALLGRMAPEGPGTADGHLDPEDARRALLGLAQDGGVAAQRVVAYLRSLRGPGDGELAVVPSRLGQWREWVPPRGMLFGERDVPRRVGELPQRRRCDPGE